MALIGYMTTTVFGYGAVREVAGHLVELGLARPLIVADPGVIAAGLVARVAENAPALASAPIFDGVGGNPTEAAADRALSLYRAENCDGLVAVGGGSSIDLAKAVALLATHPDRLETYAAILGGTPKITAAVAPVIAIPTTAGTGSEVGRGALITLRDRRKLGFLSPHLIPKRAVCDPELTLGLPRALTAATGMDAFAHCVETFLSPRENPPADAIALDGLKRVGTWIRHAVENGANRTARSEMMMAALEGGLTFQKGLGAVHALSHAIGGLEEPSLHHGTLNAVLLPAVLRFNEPVAREKYRALRAALGLPDSAPLDRYVETLNAEIGIPPNLSAMGLPSRTLEWIAAGARADHSTATNPRPAGEGDYLALLREAY